MLLISASLLLCGCANRANVGANEETGIDKTTQTTKTRSTVHGTTTQTTKTQTTIKKTTSTTAPIKVNVEKLTLRQAWDRLVAVADAPDLKFWTYSASYLDSTGKTGSYTITGYSRSENKIHYIQSSDSITGLGYASVKNPSGITNTYDIGAIKDSPQMVQEIIKLKGGCSKGMQIEFTAPKKTANASCIPEWSSVDGYEYLR